MTERAPGPPHPYRGRPARTRWRSVAEAGHPLGISDWYRKKFEIADRRIGTAGSCFAQHIGRELRANGFDFVDVEPPPGMLDRRLQAGFGYGIYSARYGNVYTTRQLLQLLQRALGEFSPRERAWQHGGGVVDPFRPTIEPGPLRDPDEVDAMRKDHLARVAKLFESIDVFVFTLGLTEAWVDARDGAVYPVAPGVAGGAYDPDIHKVVNFAHHEVRSDLEAFVRRVRSINPGMRFLLTVSPVPLMATGTDQHIIPATMYSKSVLRSVAGVISDRYRYVDYFPSYEIISSHVMRGMFYNADMRTVHGAGVSHVMREFFSQHPSPGGTAAAIQADDSPEDDLVCDEERLDYPGD